MTRAMRHLRLLLILFGFVLVSGMYRHEFKCAGILKGVVQNYWVKGLANVVGRLKIFWALILGG